MLVSQNAKPVLVIKDGQIVGDLGFDSRSKRCKNEWYIFVLNKDGLAKLPGTGSHVEIRKAKQRLRFVAENT